ncbi:MAG TPA: acyl-CoA dehydrogenase family protein [Polyangiaceae bacterium]|nr:acyl-CoA dehydrogenase family protein [Polyangiaceae bacterium]
MADLEKFRAEMRGFIDKNAPRSLVGKASDPAFQVWGGKKAKYPTPDARAWLERAAEAGLTAPTWPKEYGGAGLSREEGKIFEQELAQQKLPAPLVGFGLMMIGPTLLTYGSEEQKREHLPRICRGDIRWCQGYSEPNAGSDLASLQCSAVREGDAFNVNGQKTWTSYGDLSDWMFLLVRTDPAAKKQQGISFVLLDLDTPGVSIKPIRLISGASPFCETFLENVTIPVRNVVSEINHGWTVAKALLGHERTMIATVFGTGQRSPRADRVIEVAREAVGDASGKVTEPVLRDRVAALLMDQACFELTMQRSRDGALRGHKPGPETSFFKLYGTELNQRRQELLVALSGEAALGWEGEGYAPEDLSLTRDWLRSKGNTIEGGTSEIQLNIIAKRVLELPD